MDRGVWATWYNLPDQGRDDHVAWLHGSYLPADAEASRLPVGGALRPDQQRKDSTPYQRPPAHHCRSRRSQRRSLYRALWRDGLERVRRAAARGTARATARGGPEDA